MNNKTKQKIIEVNNVNELLQVMVCEPHDANWEAVIKMIDYSYGEWEDLEEGDKGMHQSIMVGVNVFNKGNFLLSVIFTLVDNNGPSDFLAHPDDHDYTEIYTTTGNVRIHNFHDLSDLEHDYMNSSDVFESDLISLEVYHITDLCRCVMDEYITDKRRNVELTFD
jgi:hypothetical protein